MSCHSRASTFLVATFAAFGVGSACRDLGAGSADATTAGASQSPAPDNSADTPARGGGGSSGTERGSGGEAGAPKQIIDAGAAGAPEQGSKDAAGMAGAAGTVESPSTTSASGPAGAEPPIDSSVEEVILPGCDSGVNEAVFFTRPSALAANMTGNNVPYVVYATQPETNVLFLRWKVALSDDAAWTSWQCFDLVPHPSALSAINIGDLTADTTLEVYAASATGKLFVRRFYEDITWLGWQPLDLPRPSSHVSDVAATATPFTLATVYILDSGKVFARHHSSSNAYSDYSPWVEVTGVPNGATHLCAATRPDLTEQLFVLTSDGAVSSAAQLSADANAAFSAFQSISAPGSVTDIDCGYLADRSVELFGLSQGKVLTRRGDASVSGDSDWQPEPGGSLLQIATFTVGSRVGVAPTVFGVDDGNALWWHAAGSVNWTQVPN